MTSASGQKLTKHQSHDMSALTSIADMHCANRMLWNGESDLHPQVDFQQTGRTLPLSE